MGQPLTEGRVDTFPCLQSAKHISSLVPAPARPSVPLRPFNPLQLSSAPQPFSLLQTPQSFGILQSFRALLFCLFFGKVVHISVELYSPDQPQIHDSVGIIGKHHLTISISSL